MGYAEDSLRPYSQCWQIAVIEVRVPGYAPGGAVPFFRVAERKAPKKGRPRCPWRFLGSESQFTEPTARPKGAVLRTAVKWASDPNNRNLRCSLQAGSAQTRLRLKQRAALIRLKLCSSARPEGKTETNLLSGHRCARPRPSERARRRHWGRITISRSETRAPTPIPECWTRRKCEPLPGMKSGEYWPPALYA